MTVLEMTILVLAALKVLLAALILHQSIGMTRTLLRLRRSQLHPSDAAQLKARVLAEVAKQWGA